MDTILARKRNMTQAFVDGERTPATKLVAGPCIVTSIKNENRDGYTAIQLGFGERKIKNITKPLQGHLKGAIKEKKAPSFLREVRQTETLDYKVGDSFGVADILQEGDSVVVTGTSKGKGFAGVIKRWGFAGGPRTHGQSDRQRAPGSIGQGTDPGRVRKGKKMPGRMGGKTAVVKNLQVISVNPETNEVVVSGPVPGPKGTYLVIRRLNEREQMEDSQNA